MVFCQTAGVADPAVEVSAPHDAEALLVVGLQRVQQLCPSTFHFFLGVLTFLASVDRRYDQGRIEGVVPRDNHFVDFTYLI